MTGLVVCGGWSRTRARNVMAGTSVTMVFTLRSQHAVPTFAEARRRALDVFRSFPAAAEPLLDYHEALLRGPSPYPVAERELIAAYTSGLNACGYCHGVHSATAEAFGVPEGTLQALLDDVDAAPVDERMRPVLRYVRNSPSRRAGSRPAMSRRFSPPAGTSRRCTTRPPYAGSPPSATPDYATCCNAVA